MAKILVLYYSMHGHIEKMAQSAAESTLSISGIEVDIKRVPEIVSNDDSKQSRIPQDQKAPLATVAELDFYDAIIFGTPTRFGNMCAQMRNFLDQSGKLFMGGYLIGKV